MRELNANFAWACAIADELALCGVRHVVVSPGSRSAPLALAFSAHPRLHDRSILDERSAGFFALGLARTRREPVALLCTSGTAAANYLPAAVEAHYSRIPLLLLTADRPPELRDRGAGQVIDQVKLYGGYVRFFAELPTPVAESERLRFARGQTCRAVEEARRGGPVHLNVPLREPLQPERLPAEAEALAALEPLARAGRARRPLTRVSPPAPLAPSAETVSRLARTLRSEARGWLVVGPLDAAPGFADRVGRLARLLGWPVLAEPLSQLRTGPHDRASLVDAHDAVLRVEPFVRAYAPRVVLRFGAMPTSRAYQLALEAQPEIEQIMVDPHGWSDPSALAAEIVRADPTELAAELVSALEAASPGGEWSERWLGAGRAARRALDLALDQLGGISEPASFRALARAVPEGTAVYCASSMPVRDADLFWPSAPRRLRFLANRGANGIDGTLSSAVGVAVGHAGPTVLVTGDLALLHDLSGLLAARTERANLLVVVLDNNGGGIFEMLPLADSVPREQFERHFGTPHHLDLVGLLRGFGIVCRDVTQEKELLEVARESLARPGVEVIRVATDRRENADLHRRLFGAVEAALLPEV
ncbi:MAG: 2-succinyl-5-enolpyruvyl-6-hydroxy-3-cyclohexene-1-carboxylic-acid synthase [Myxococcota bacterium]